MRLKRLTINNFRVLRDVDLHLPDEVIGIIGPNGAGKSSLVEAIAWALYGHQAARSGKSEIKSQFAQANDSCAVELEFELNGQPFRIIRKLVGRSERAEVELYRSDKQEAVGVAVTREYMTELLGLDLRGFLTSFLARQQELNALSDLTPTERQNHLAGMMGVGQLDKAIQILKGDIKGFGDKIDYIERQLAGKEDVLERLEEASARISELKPRREQLAQKLTTSRRELESAVDLAKAWQDRRSAFREMAGRLKAERSALEDAETRLAELDKEVLSLERLEIQKVELEKSTRGLETARSRLEALRQAAANQVRRDKALKQMAQLQKRQVATKRELDEDLTSLQQIQHELKDIPEDVESGLNHTRTDLEKAREQYAEIREQRGGVEGELNKLTGQIEHIAELGPQSICDRCRRPFGNDLPGIRDHLTRERESLTAKLTRLDDHLSHCASEGKQLRQKVADLEKAFQQQRDLAVRLKTVEERIANRREQSKDLDERIEQLSAEMQSVGDADFKPEQLAEAEKEVARLESERRRLDEITGRLQRLPVAQAERRNLRKRLEDGGATVSKLEKEIAKIEFDPEAAAGAEQRQKEVQAKVDEAREKLVQADKELELAEQNQAHLTAKREELNRAEQELNRSREDRFYGEKLAGLMTRFRKELVAGIRPRLAELSSGLFDEMTGGKYNLVELDDKYNLRILDNGQFFGVERFSGGEKDLANLCLRLAISRSLTDSAGLDRSFVILDEVFGSQDNERKDLIIEALTRLQNRFPQILLITHVEEIRDRVGCLIEVQPSGRGYSEVNVA